MPEPCLRGGLLPHAANPIHQIENRSTLLQTNLQGIDYTLDIQRLVKQVAELPVNTLLLNLGGIIARYPTRVELRYARGTSATRLL